MIMNSLLKVSIKLKSLPRRVFLILYISTTIYKTRDFPFFKGTSTKCISDALSEVDKYGCEAKVVDAMKKLGDSPSSADDLKEAYCR